MALQPALYKEYMDNLKATYEKLEQDLMAEVARRMANGLDDHYWQELKLRQVREHLATIRTQLDDIARAVPQEVGRVISSAYDDGSAHMDRDIRGMIYKSGRQSDIAPAAIGFGTVNSRAIELLVAETVTKMAVMHTNILRSVNDQYRGIISSVAASIVSGSETRQQAVQRALNEFATRGISGFTDAAGRRWDIATYAEMALRTAATRSYMAGATNRIKSYGLNLVIVSSHPVRCPRCAKWERQILALDDSAGGEYPTLDDATSGGLFHPNCGHSYTAYVEGLTKIDEPHHDDELYKMTQKQRYNERMIRHWKKQEAVAITPEAKARAAAKVKAWQKTQRDHIKSDDRLRRDYAREQVRRGRTIVPPKPPTPPKPAWHGAMTHADMVAGIKSSTGVNINGADALHIDTVRGIAASIESVMAKVPYLKGRTHLIDIDSYDDWGIEDGSAAFTFKKDGWSTVSLLRQHWAGEAWSKTAKDFEQSRQNGFLVKGDGINAYSAITHEYGHVLTNLINKSKVIDGVDAATYVRGRVLATLELKPYQIASRLSQYASYDDDEFFAEAFTEFVDGKNPGEIARVFGAEIADIIKKMEGKP